MRSLLLLAAMLPLLAGTPSASADDCPVRPRGDAGTGRSGCKRTAPRPLREDAVAAQKPRPERGDTTIELGGRVRAEGWGQSHGR